MVHSLSPFLLQFSETFGIRWYGTAYLVGFLFGYFLVSWLSERQSAGLSRALVGDFVTTIAIGTLVGGRLGYALFYSPDLFIKFKSDFPYWGLLAVNEGGLILFTYSISFASQDRSACSSVVLQISLMAN